MKGVISLISAGAPQFGVMECIDVYKDITGISFNDSYMTSSEIKNVMQGEELIPDILIARAKDMEEFGSVGLLDVTSFVRVGVESGKNKEYFYFYVQLCIELNNGSSIPKGCQGNLVGRETEIE